MFQAQLFPHLSVTYLLMFIFCLVAEGASMIYHYIPAENNPA